MFLFESELVMAQLMDVRQLIFYRIQVSIALNIKIVKLSSSIYHALLIVFFNVK